MVPTPRPAPCREGGAAELEPRSTGGQGPFPSWANSLPANQGCGATL